MQTSENYCIYKPSSKISVHKTLTETIMNSAIKQSFKINLEVLQFLGLYCGEKTKLKKWQSYLIYFLCITPMPFFGISYLLVEEELDMDRVYDNAFLLADMACYIVKLFPFIENADKIKKCVEYFEAPIFTASGPEKRKIMDECIRICKRNSVIFFIFVCGGIISWAIKPFLWTGYYLPVDVWLPFELIPGSALNYVIYLFLVTGGFYAAGSNSTIDPLIGGLAYQAATQIKILKYNLQHLDSGTSESIYDKIKKSVYHHKAILRFINEYEDCFSLVVFTQFIGSVFTVCLCCLQLSKLEPLTLNFFMMGTYLFACLCQIYFYCYYGTTLFEESDSLTRDIYMAHWIEFDLKAQKALIILMERSNKPIMLTAGKILNLSLDTFTTILRRSYSLLALLQSY